MILRGKTKPLLKDLIPPGSLPEKLASLAFVVLYAILIMRGELLGVKTAITVFAGFSAFAFTLIAFSNEFYFSKKVYLFIIAFSLVLVISAIRSQVPEESISKIFIYLSSFIVFFVSFSLSYKHKRYSIWLFNIVFIYGLYVVIKFFLVDVLAQTFQAGGYFIGPFYWHNQMAAFLLYLIPLPLVNLLLNRKKQTLVWLIVLIFLLTTFVFTFSRGAWLSLILPITAGVFFFRKKIKIDRWAKFTVILALIIGIIVFINSDTAFNRAKSIAQEILPGTRTTSGNLRAGIYPSSIRTIKDFPLTGIGPGVFGQAFHHYQNQPWLYAANAHNHFLQIAVETGIIGFLLFSLIFIAIGKVIFKYRKENLKKADERSIYLVALTVAISAAFIHNMIDVDWNLPSLSYLFWLLLGTLLGGVISNKKEVILAKKSSTKLIVLFMVFYTALIFGLFSFNKQLESGKFFFLRREFDKSLSIFSKVDAVFPYSYTSHLYQARIYQIGKIYDKALKEYKESSTLNTFLAEPDYSQGIIYLTLGDTESAKVHFNEAINKNPYSSPHYYKALADIYFLEGDTENAANILKKAVTEAFLMNESYQNFSYLYKLTGFDKSLANIYLAYAQLLTQQGNPAEAKNVVEQAILYLDPVNIRLQELDSNLKNALP